jgi:hypothetical protein
LNRRGFLKFFSAAAVTAVGVDLGQLLLPEKTYFLPPVGGWHKEGLLFVPSLWSDEILATFHKELVFADVIRREYNKHIRNDLKFMAGDSWPNYSIKIHAPSSRLVHV